MRNPLKIKPVRTQNARDGNLRSLRRHALLGTAVLAVLVLGLGGWVSAARVEGAVIASGVVVVEGGSRKIQHPEGGIVRQILVQDNDVVTAGQLLVRLDDVYARAELEIILAQLRENLGARARLTAESLGQSALATETVPGIELDDAKLSTVMTDQLHLFLTRRQSVDNAVARIAELITQKEASIVGQQQQLTAYASQMSVIVDELGQQETLAGKGLVSSQRLNEIKRSKAEIEGEVAAVQASIAATKSSIAELHLQSEQEVADFRSDALNELQQVSQTVAELSEKVIAAQARLARLEIRAPIDGTVHESTVHTVGGVVSPGEALMLIVPRAVHLVVDLRVNPYEVSKLQVGQAADVRLLSFDPRTTDLLVGDVASISPDLLQDSKSGASYFSVRVDVADSELPKLPKDAELVPGMPAEAFFRTGDRSVLSYLLGPLEERFTRTFREN